MLVNQTTCKLGAAQTNLNATIASARKLNLARAAAIFIFFIYLRGARLITGKEFKKPRSFLFFQFFHRGKIMANPQKEKGYTAIANEIIEALAVIRISGEEWQCLCCILRKTYGWRKIKDAISLSQFQESTGIKKQNICRALNRLLSKNIIIVIKKDKGITEYALQKDYELWKPLSKKITLKSLSKKITPVIKKDKETAKIVIKKETHKRNIKTTITKERNPKKENWLKMIDKNLGKELSVFEKSDLEKIKKKLDAPTYERLLLILKEKDGEQ